MAVQKRKTKISAEAQLNLKEREQAIRESSDKILVQKVSVLADLLSNSMIDSDKASFSEPSFKPVIEDHDDLETIRRKIMELIKKF